jgi:hypothetical protein
MSTGVITDSICYNVGKQTLTVYCTSGSVWEYYPITLESYLVIKNAKDLDEAVKREVHKGAIIGIKR